MAGKFTGLGGKFGRFGRSNWQVWAENLAGLGGQNGRFGRKIWQAAGGKNRL